MNFYVNWTTEAEISFNENIEYLANKWDIPTINQFLDRVDEVIGLISENPDLYPVYRRQDNVHKCVLNRNVTLFYRKTEQNQIDLITFWGSYKNPKRLRL